MMLFTTFKATAEKYPLRLALNDLSYAELLMMVESDDDNGCVLTRILRAARRQQNIIVKPMNTNDIKQAKSRIGFYLVLWSSGSTGIREPVYITEDMILANAKNSIECNAITPEDIVYTVCSMSHTGGINAQSLPALLAGAHVITEEFNAFTFFRRINELGATITHVVPRMLPVLMRMEHKATPTLKTVMCGSDCIDVKYVEFFNSLGCDFIINYGLTEAGPVIISHRFKPNDDLTIFDHGVPLGTKTWANAVIIGPQLCLIGKSVIDGSMVTDDCVYMRDDWFMYQGRVSAGCKIIPKAY